MDVCLLSSPNAVLSCAHLKASTIVARQENVNVILLQRDREALPICVRAFHRDASLQLPVAGFAGIRYAKSHP
jgi:hypothetical protein